MNDARIRETRPPYRYGINYGRERGSRQFSGLAGFIVSWQTERCVDCMIAGKPLKATAVERSGPVRWVTIEWGQNIGCGRV
jgi:hypothetical protein